MVAAATRSRRFNFLVMLMVSKVHVLGEGSLSARIDNGRKRKLQYTRQGT